MLSTREAMTVETAGARLGVPGWRVRQLFTRRLLPEPRRFGNSRIIFEEDLPTIREALVKAGFLHEAIHA
jgi:hypothetical protein